MGGVELREALENMSADTFICNKIEDLQQLDSVDSVYVKKFYHDSCDFGGRYERDAGIHTGGTFIADSKLSIVPNDWNNSLQVSTYLNKGSTEESGWRLVLVNNIVPAEAFGMSTELVDNHTQYMSAINSTKLVDGSTALSLPVKVSERGEYNFLSTLEIKTKIHLMGNGGDCQVGIMDITFVFPEDVEGIIFHRRNTIGHGLEIPYTQGADGSIFQDIKLQGGGGTSQTANGIWLRCRVALKNVVVRGFANDNIRVLATADGIDSEEGNANSWSADGLYCRDAGKDGLYVAGRDVNAGYAKLINCINNTKVGINDNSILGNTYVACHTRGNETAYDTTGGNSSASVLVGCYSEGGQGDSKLSSRTIVVGGMHATPFDNTDGVVLNADGTTLVNINGGVSSKDVSDVGNIQTTIIGGDANNQDYLKFYNSLDADNSWRLRGKEGDLVFDYSNANSNRPFEITGENTLQTFGRNTPVSYKFKVSEFALGAGSNARIYGTSSIAPASGYHARGEIVFNYNPSASGFIGWVCVASGESGVWKQFGGIEA